MRYRIFPCVLALAVTAVIAASPAEAGWRYGSRGCPPVPCQSCPPGTVMPGVPQPADGTPTPADGEGIPDLGEDFDIGGDGQLDFDAQQNVIPVGQQAATSPTSFAGNMIGDFQGGFGYATNDALSGDFVPSGAGSSIFKVSDNGVVLPVDRVFFNYNHFHKALYFNHGVDEGRLSVDQYTFGLEKTFFDGMASLEVRIPFAHTADSYQADGAPFASANEFGNIKLIPKVLLISNGRTDVAVGLGIGLPTSDDTFIDGGVGDNLIVESESVVLTPFLGFNHRLSSRWWTTGYIQAAFDTNGSTVIVDDVVEGVYQEQTLLALDMALNYDLYYNPQARYFRSITPTLELHYATTLQDTDIIDDGGGDGIRNPFGRLDILNLTAGFHIDVTRVSRLSVAAVVPLRREEAEDVFHLPDSEIVIQFNRFF